MLNIKVNNSLRVKQALESAFSGLSFDEASHTYKLKGQKLISTSKWLKQYYESFNTYEIAKAKANKFNKENCNDAQIDHFYYIYRWKQISEAATNTGTRVHNYAEYNYPLFSDTPYCEQEQGVVDFYKDLDSKYEVVFLELKMFIEKYGKAGTADIILYNNDTGNILLADWKTNQKNILQHYKGKTMLKQFSHLTDCALNKYSLQLSDYQNMIEMNTGLKVEDRWIIHLSSSDYTQKDYSKRNDDNYHIDTSNPPFIEKSLYKVYRTKDYTKELMLDYE